MQTDQAADQERLNALAEPEQGGFEERIDRRAPGGRTSRRADGVGEAFARIEGLQDRQNSRRLASMLGLSLECTVFRDGARRAG